MVVKCQINCCTERASDMRVGEQYPVFIDVSEWLESVRSRQVSEAHWTVRSKTKYDANDIVICDEKIDQGSQMISANLSDGDGGVMYEIDVSVVTCEGHIGRFCFQQFVQDC